MTAADYYAVLSDAGSGRPPSATTFHHASGRRPDEQFVAGVLVGSDRDRWEAVGRALDAGLYSERRAVCERCLDRVCAACWRTDVNRWLPTQRCPLGFWPK